MDMTGALGAFAGSLRFPTISPLAGEGSAKGPFIALHDFLRDAFPRVHDRLEREEVAGASLLYTWEGSDVSLEPTLLSAHMDVVPPGDADDWRYPPFSGTITEDRVWGRGAVDYKVGVTGMLQACEDLLGSGFTPRRTVHLAFGHDEEVGGPEGATSISAILADRGVRLRTVLDEGGYVYSYPWLRTDIAVIGLAEKGYLTLRLTVEGDQGHASRPPLRTPLGILGESLDLLERHQMPELLCGPVRELFRGTAHLWREEFLEGIKDRNSIDHLALASSAWPDGNALVRSTTAPTMVSGSSRENILPGSVFALVNFRAVPGEGTPRILGHVRDLVEPLGVRVGYEDPRHVFEPSPVSSTDTPEYRSLTSAIRSVWPGMTVSPGIFPAATDSRHYQSMADSVYRFVPVHLGRSGLGALHSEDESVSVEDYFSAVAFYTQYIRSITGPGDTDGP